MTIDRSTAEKLDAADLLADYRNRFVINDETLIYLDGNSLGRLPIASRERVRRVLEDDWGQHLIRSWTDRWLDLPSRIGDLIGQHLLGARPGDVIVSDSTTVALYKAISAALDARPGRRSVVIERDNFPTDRYLVESLAQQRGLEIRWVEPAGTEGVTDAQLAAVLDETVAVAVLSQVDYRSAALLDMKGLTARLHSVGALSVWDLCHSVGSVPIDLVADEVDIAVGCTYKYLNGGPGAPSFTYVRADLRDQLRQPIWGWWGRREMFDMDQGFDAQPDMQAWLSGTPSVLSMAAIEPGVAMIAEAGMPPIRDKSCALTALAVDLHDEWLEPQGWVLATPRDPSRRGSHVTVARADALEVTARLVESGVIPDFRRPDGIRLGLAPLTTRFVDVYDGMARIAQEG
ncbi:MAG: kynureninase [Nocardioidaceae bacterium]|nr:kynureninase [Nocardioidaceae bacterium]